ncbi:MAG: sulfatase [Phycisphaeraceae bacterium]
MKVVMVMFDSLNRHMLPPYGCDWVHAPNFQRLAQKTVTFNTSYICSMPCMPARRDFHTGRPNFLHCPWGPLEPFDDSVPQMLRQAGVYTHLASDHYHYWEDGGSNYHCRYNSWEFARGQEGDPWIGQVRDPAIPPATAGRDTPRWRQDWVNRAHMRREEQQPQPKTFASGIDFIRRNHDQDNWFLQIETFDPHEPFFTHRKYKDLYAEHYQRYAGKHFDWPPYRPVQETPQEVEHARHEYAALVSMCDSYLGEVLDTMDQLNLWEDTMLIVWTDHGFLLGEHDHWAKMRTPWYEELAHTPFFMWDPRCGKKGERRDALVQPAIDLGPTLLEFFGVPATADMTGKVLRDTVARDAPVREAALFGVFGGQVNVTDGRYVYMRPTAAETTAPLYRYTLMPATMAARLDTRELAQVELAGPFSFTKGCRVMRIGSGQPHPSVPSEKMWLNADCCRQLLYDVHSDPHQTAPIEDAAVTQRLTEQMVLLMRQCDAPPEQYQRLGLEAGISSPASVG